MAKELDVVITIPVHVMVRDGADVNEIRNEAWFQMHHNADPSNWPDGTNFVVADVLAVNGETA